MFSNEIEPLKEDTGKREKSRPKTLADTFKMYLDSTPEEDPKGPDGNQSVIQPTYSDLAELQSTVSLYTKLRKKRRCNALDAAEILLDHGPSDPPRYHLWMKVNMSYS